MKSVPAWLTYSVIRLLLFAVPLVVLLVAGVGPIVATILAAIIGLCLSYIFLRTTRSRMADSVYSARHRPARTASEPVPTADALAEDAALDRQATATPETAPASEGEGRPEQHAEGERGETGEFQGKHELP